MSGAVIQGDARALPLPDASVDLIVTSPPYFGQRVYLDGGERYAAQIGAEASPQEYVASLIKTTREMARVLKPSGSIFVNLGDKYAGQRYRRSAPEKSLMLIPERYRLACLDELNLTVRSVNIWAKPWGLPDPATDRHGRTHEDWVHLTKSGRYYSDLDQIREPHDTVATRSMTYQERVAAGLNTKRKGCRGVDISDNDAMPSLARHPIGKTPRSVWTNPVATLRVPPEVAQGVKHTAGFPPGIVQPLVIAFSPPDGVVLDPYGGTGTTALVAHVHGRIGISLDASSDYNRIATWRVNDEKQIKHTLYGFAG